MKYWFCFVFFGVCNLKYCAHSFNYAELCSFIVLAIHGIYILIWMLNFAWVIITLWGFDQFDFTICLICSIHTHDIIFNMVLFVENSYWLILYFLCLFSLLDSMWRLLLDFALQLMISQNLLFLVLHCKFKWIQYQNV